MFKFFIKIILIFFLTVFNINALTFKNDGSIVSSNGVIIKESSYKRYQKALEQYFNGETVSDWPTVDLNKKGKPQKKKGFFVVATSTDHAQTLYPRRVLHQQHPTHSLLSHIIMSSIF